MLRSTRQQYHQRIAQVLEARFPADRRDATRTPGAALHEAGLGEQAFGYWQRAGQRAAARRLCGSDQPCHERAGGSSGLPNPAEHTQQELDLQLTFGLALMVSKAYSAPEVAQAYARAYALCQQVGDTPQVFPALWGLWAFNCVVAKMHTRPGVGRAVPHAGPNVCTIRPSSSRRTMPGVTLVYLGDLAPARVRLEQGIALYDVEHHHSQTVLYGGHDPGVCCLVHAAWVLWLLGYPAQARLRGQEAHALARGSRIPLAHALQ